MKPHPNGYIVPSRQEIGELLGRLRDRSNEYGVAHGDSLLMEEARKVISALLWERDAGKAGGDL